jgi:hypothetical protein
MGILSRSVIIIVAVLISNYLMGEEVKYRIARRVAINFYLEKSAMPLNQLVLGDEIILKEKGSTLGYVFNLNSGYIIVSGDDAVFPVLAYSFESAYSGQGFPPAFNFWMEQYKLQISTAIEEHSKPTKVIQEIWSRYKDDNFYPKEVLTEVQPLIHTTWHQGCFYNSFFPEEPLAPCGHLWTGCVATAMGQILKYYNYPLTGQGFYGYNSSYGYVSADFQNTEYDWVAMDYHLNSEDSSVAELLYHSAISIHSQFFPNGTGAYDFNARNAMVEYFRYSPDAHFYWRDSYPGDWKALLRSELDQGRPVLYGGADSQTNAGHTLVCDGYQDTSFFHFNWGWNGYYNGYFYLDSLIAGINYFNFQHDAVVGIKPDIPGTLTTTPPENILVSITYKTVNLTWDPVVSTNPQLLGYNLFRDGAIVNPSIINVTNYMDENVPEGDHTYYIRSVYSGAESSPSVSIPVYISVVVESPEPQFSIYPNPANDYLMIVSERFNNGQVLIRMSDITGRTIHEWKYRFDEDNKVRISLSDTGPGVFFLYIQTMDGTYSKKIVICK